MLAVSVPCRYLHTPSCVVNRFDVDETLRLLGALAGLRGDGWNLGFVVETERQVEAHLNDHLGRLPPQDVKSRAVVEQMKVDEREHADLAVRLGAAELPAPAKVAMRAAAKVMTRTAYFF